MSLASNLKPAREIIINQVAQPIETLGQVAQSMQQPTLSMRLTSTIANMRSDHFKIIVVGRFKNGKSTFMNALLGRVTNQVPELEHIGGLLPMDELPATATLTRIKHGEQTTITAVKMDGSSEIWSINKFIQESTVKIDAEENRHFFSNLREFRITYPAELCKENVILIDSPGTDDDPVRDQITLNAVRECDAAIVVYRHAPFAGQGEREFVENNLRKAGVKIFTVVNLWNDAQNNERLKHFVWDRLITEKNPDKKYNGQDLASQNIFFVNCLQALEATQKQSQVLMRTSGLENFQDHLGQFLIRDRLGLHLGRFVQQALLYSEEIGGLASQRLAALKMEQIEFQKVYEQIRPRLEEMRKRQRRLSTIFAQYLRLAQSEAQTSWTELINDLIQNLAKDMDEYPLDISRSDKLLLPIRAKKIANEAKKIAENVILRKMQNWQDEILPNRLSDCMKELENEIKTEVTEISRSVQLITQDLTLKTTINTPDISNSVSTTESLIWIGVGTLMGRPDWAAMGGIKGWRGMLSGVATEVSVISVLILTGVSSIPVLALVGMVVGIITALINLPIGFNKYEKEIKQKTAQLIINGDTKHNLQGLSVQFDTMRHELDEKIASSFKELELAITREVDDVVNNQIRQIESLADENQRSINDKHRLISETEQYLRNIVKAQGLLKEGLLATRQL